MAGTVTVSATLVDSAFGIAHVDATQSIARAGDAYLAQVQIIGSNSVREQLATNSDITTVGWAFFKNLDDTDTISLATADTAVYFAKLAPTERFAIHLGQATVWAISDGTNSPELQYTILEV